MHVRAGGASNSHMSYDTAHDDAPVSSDDRLLARVADDSPARVLTPRLGGFFSDVVWLEPIATEPSASTSVARDE